MLKLLKNIYFTQNIAYTLILLSKPVYMDKNISNLQIILIQQNKAIRIFLNQQHDASVQEHFKQLNILTVFG